MHVAFAVQSIFSIDICTHVSSGMRCKAALTMLADAFPARLGHLASGHSNSTDPACPTSCRLDQPRRASNLLRLPCLPRRTRKVS